MSSDFDEKCKGSESRNLEHNREPLGGQRGKIMGKLIHNYNAFKELRTKFFKKQCVIWSSPASFNEFRHKLHFQNFKYNSVTINNEEKVTRRGISH